MNAQTQSNIGTTLQRIGTKNILVTLVTIKLIPTVIFSILLHNYNILYKIFYIPIIH